VDQWWGADALGHLELAVELVDADDLARAADARALHDREPHATAAEHGDGLTRLQSRRAQRGADTGEHAAAHERRAIEREIGIDLHERVLVQQDALGVARNPEEPPHRPPALQ